MISLNGRDVNVSETHYSLKEMETIVCTVKQLFKPFVSETHYSLKEMETLQSLFVLVLKKAYVGNPLLSERDGNHQMKHNSEILHLEVGNPLLSERDGNTKFFNCFFAFLVICRKPTTL